MAAVARERMQCSWCVSNDTTGVGLPPMIRMPSSSTSPMCSRRGSMSRLRSLRSFMRACSCASACSRQCSLTGSTWLGLGLRLGLALG
eukprot:scaffold43886_cov61-Phaeocystis_antarctica.AAC.1